jgi:ATP/maltotriose-dependent transcriptional regulator MalT/DNA-binding XRE family transcriptional regulator
MSVEIRSENFGSLLKFLRKRAHLTQRDLAQAVGYTEAHICRLEKDERLPDLTTVAALFIPALDIKDDPAMMERLLKLAAEARNERQPTSVKISQVTIKQQVDQELGALEDIPALPVHVVNRPELTQRIRASLASDQCVALCDMAGMGKTTLAAAIARSYQDGPVFWHTLVEGVNTSAEAIVRQLALFLLAHGRTQVKPLVEKRTEAAPISLDQQLMLLRSALANQPSLLCFENVHLLQEDETSFSLLRYLGTTTSASLLLTSRQEVPLPFTQINLGGLEPEEARTLIEHMGLDLDPDLLERLFEKTERNPMLLRLAAGQLVEHRTDAQAFLEHLETQPQVASYLLNTVLDDLPAAAQWLAGFLSTFRQPIDLYDDTMVELIRKAGQADSYEEALNALQHRYLIENARHADLHPLVRDYLYAALSTDAPRKKQAHRLAAQFSEHGLGDIVEAAYHWTMAGDLEQAAEVIGDQSEQLFNRGQANAAVQVVDEALERAGRKRGDTANLRRRLLKARGDLLRGTFRASESETSYREALSLAQNLPAVRAEIVRNLAQILLQRGRTAEALRLCQSAMKDLSPNDIVLRARLGAIEARANLALSHYEEAERIASEAIALANQFAEALPQVADDVWARAERTLGWVNYTRHPEGAESLVHYRRALECARRAGLRVVENAILSNTATALMERGDTEGALQAYQEALKGYEALGDVYGSAGILHNLGALYSGREDYESALAHFEKASELERRVGDVEGLLSSESARASTLLSLGKLAEARAALDRVLVDGKESTDTWTMGTCLCLLAEVQLLQGEFETARSTAKQVLSMPGIEDNARIRAWAQSDLALIQIGAEEFIEARNTVAVTPPGDLGFELTSRWQLVQSAAALACGDSASAHQIARLVIESAQPKGLKQLCQTAEKIITEPDLKTSDLPYLILVGR